MKLKLMILANFVACSGAQSKCSSECVFPFVWDGVTYTACTDVDTSPSHFWCVNGMKDGWKTTTTCDDECSNTGGNEEPAPGLAHSSSSSSCSSYPATHTMMMYPGPAPDCQVRFSGLDQADKDFLLTIHNELRQKVAAGNEVAGWWGQPAASNMRKLVWNDELADIAQRWAGQCQFDHDEMIDLCDGTSVGQNIANSWTSTEYPRKDVLSAFLRDSVEKQWYSEKTNPGFSSWDIKPFKSSKGVGHYTQLVWADTNKLGCGMVNYEEWGKFTTYLVCNYAVQGNIIGEAMYLKGPGCGNCPAGTTCDTTFNALCV